MAIPAWAPMPGDEAPSTPRTPRRSSTPMFLLGILSRTWLWFVAGCVLVTIVPMLFGWRPYVVQSGSMMPRIAVGDVVLASPVDDPALLLGRVTVFRDPSTPAITKTHRVMSIDGDGRMITKGDANTSVDSTPITIADVEGMGRLLVQFVGLPLIWVSTQQWVYLGALVLSLLLAAWVTARDRDEDVDEDEDDPDGGGPPGGDLLPLPRPAGGSGATAVAASTPMDPRLRREAGKRWAQRAGYGVVLTGALTLPTVNAAFAATTATTANSWRVAAPSYSDVVTGLRPWMWWKLDETGTGSTAADSSGNGRAGSFVTDGSSTYVTKGVVGAIPSETPNRAVTLTNADSCVVTTSTSGTSSPGNLTAVAWFRTTTTSGGTLLGFESPRTGVTAYASGGRYGRQLYMDARGTVWFGTSTNQTIRGLQSPTALNDGQWHMAAGVLSSAGMRLYIDGALVGSNTVSSVSSYTGWWRAGCGNLSGWGSLWDGGSSPSASWNQPRNFPFAGSLDEVSVWNQPLTATDIAALWAAR
ncbi:LamG-like jellyroll fold domain-containing protein [Longivirga aurantiaca]|uniref:LamG-like jellyroll fold domain-containing protein n=1 Tax=Longivirga aurantiaca TaxID=1837743 RepID=A0ABW1T088_9ACTN